MPRAPNHLGSAEKSKSKAITVYFLPKDLRFEMGAPNLFLDPAPSNLDSSVWMSHCW